MACRKTPTKQTETGKRLEALKRARKVALDDAKAWKKGQLRDDADDMHETLLDEMANAGLSRPDRIGLRACLWSLPSY